MEIRLLAKTARSATIAIEDGGIYYTREEYDLFLNARLVQTTDRVITSIFSLKPETAYQLEVMTKAGESKGKISFTTGYEFVTLDVREFGAKGDGIHNDTSAIQAAILSCPEQSRVLITRGTYAVGSLFLKSNISLEITGDAVLSAIPDKTLYPVLPGLIESYDEKEEYNLGTWEGNPLKMYASILTGIGVENVTVYGEGTIEGNAAVDNWWKNPKKMDGAFRPRMLFLNGCRNITVQGLLFQNSPCWTIHPYFSDDLRFYGLTVKNPANSPNTDGLDPESCVNVDIAGVKFSLGDDCIAVKAGKIYFGKKHKRSSENIKVFQCLMENGHGAVTIGSEMAGGVKKLIVENCLFSHTDRGLRIKTRRGRGEDAVLDEIVFRNIKMDHVMTPLVVNCFYCCDPDGKSEYVQSRELYPADERTPRIKKLVFEHIEATNCHVAAAYFDGLPEQKIEEIEMRDIHISFCDNPVMDVPSMSMGVEPCVRKGMYLHNVKKAIVSDVTVTGQDGEAFILENVEESFI